MSDKPRKMVAANPADFEAANQIKEARGIKVLVLSTLVTKGTVLIINVDELNDMINKDIAEGFGARDLRD